MEFAVEQTFNIWRDADGWWVTENWDGELAPGTNVFGPMPDRDTTNALIEERKKGLANSIAHQKVVALTMLEMQFGISRDHTVH